MKTKTVKVSGRYNHQHTLKLKGDEIILTLDKKTNYVSVGSNSNESITGTLTFVDPEGGPLFALWESAKYYHSSLPDREISYISPTKDKKGYVLALGEKIAHKPIIKQTKLLRTNKSVIKSQ